MSAILNRREPTPGPMTRSSLLADYLATMHAAYRAEDAEGRLLWAMMLYALLPPAGYLEALLAEPEDFPPGPMMPDRRIARVAAAIVCAHDVLEVSEGEREALRRAIRHSTFPILRNTNRTIERTPRPNESPALWLIQ